MRFGLIKRTTNYDEKGGVNDIETKYCGTIKFHNWSKFVEKVSNYIDKDLEEYLVKNVLSFKDIDIKYTSTNAWGNSQIGICTCELVDKDSKHLKQHILFWATNVDKEI